MQQQPEADYCVCAYNEFGAATTCADALKTHKFWTQVQEKFQLTPPDKACIAIVGVQFGFSAECKV